MSLVVLYVGASVLEDKCLSKCIDDENHSMIAEVFAKPAVCLCIVILRRIHTEKFNENKLMHVKMCVSVVVNITSISIKVE